MNTNGIIRIRKRTQPQWLIWLLVVLPFLFGTLVEFIGLPWSIRYVLDIAWILLLFGMNYYKQRRGNRITVLVVWVAVFILYTLFAYLLQYQSALYYLWGVRNNFRGYVVFFACVVFLTQELAEDMFKLFDKIFWINLIVTLFQYFVLGFDGDHLGGIFGTEVGGNAYTNIFCSIVLTRTLVLYLEKKETTLQCMAKFVAALVVAVLAELKIFFVEVLVIIALAVLVTNFTWRKLWVVLGGIVAVFAGAFLVSILFPTFAGWFSLDWIISSTISDKGYTNTGDVNRLNAIPVINELWLETKAQRAFGLGLGNCDTSSFAALDTPFFQKNGDMHYSWISYAQMYLECGWVGLVFSFGFFILLIFFINKIRRHSTGLQRTYSRMSLILAILCVLLLVYNSSLRTEAANMMFFALAIPFISAGKQTQTEAAFAAQPEEQVGPDVAAQQPAGQE